MGWTSMDDFVNEVTNNGKFFRADWNKITGAAAYTAGRWYDTSILDGSPQGPVSHGNILLNSRFQGGSVYWTLGTGWAWTIGSNVITKTAGTGSNATQTPGLALVNGVTYTVVMTVATWTAGTFTVSVGGTNGTARGSASTFTEDIVAGAGTDISIVANATAAGTISAIYVFPKLIFTPYTNSTISGGIYHGGDVSTDTKHVLNVSAITAVATGVPGVLMLCDILGAYPRINMNSASSQTLDNTPTLPRYTSGAGVRAFLVADTGTTGATAHNFTYSYTNQASTSNRNAPVTVACTASAIVPHIVHSGVAASNYGPFIPLAAGDSGIKSVQSVQLSAASGTATFASLVLAKPLLTLPITTASVAAERDLMNQLPSLPQIYDGAYLSWLFFPGAATAASTNFYGSIDFGWG